MATKDDWLVMKSSGPRPAGRPDECFYCQAKLGDQHVTDCVLRKRSVRVRFSFDLVVSVPELWTSDQIEFRYNEGTHCSDNVIDMLHERFRGDDSNDGSCSCSIMQAEFIGEATEYEYETSRFPGLDEED